MGSKKKKKSCCYCQKILEKVSPIRPTQSHASSDAMHSCDYHRFFWTPISQIFIIR